MQPFVQGLVRDRRVRSALEAGGLDYQDNLLERGEQILRAHRAAQPSGEIPVFERVE